MASLSESESLIIEGVNAGDQSGISVSGIGDFNGDNISDVVIGSHQADPNGISSGQAHVVFGESLFPIDPETGQQYQPGQLIVEFNAGVTEAEIQAIATANGATSVENIIPSESSLAQDFAQWLILNFDLATDLVPIQNNLANNNQLNVSSFDYIVSINALPALPNDTDFNDLWGLHNTGQTGGTVDADIDAPEAWCKQKGDHDIVVAVIDTGIDYNHPDLASNMWINAGEIAGNGMDDDGNGYMDDIYGYDFHNTDSDPWDDHSHGTHVAGTIGAEGNNNSGVIGVSPNVSLMALKSFSAGGFGSTSNIINSLQYAIDNGADVVNASFGGGGYNAAFDAMIGAANSAGVLFVAAAGNFNNDNDVTPFYPANYTQPNVISVAATDHNDNKAGFSHYGSTTVDLGAPGVNIRSTLPGNSYGYNSGTSMAAPHVSGAAALLLAEDPSLTPAQIITELMNNTDPVPGLSGITVSGGRLNVNEALMSVGPIGNNAPIINNNILQTGTWRLDVSVGDINNPPNDFQPPVFIDPDGDGMHYTATLLGGGPLPGWLSFSQDNAFNSDDDVIYFTGTPPASQTFPITIELTATDCWGASTNHIFSINQYIDGYGQGDVHFKTFDGRRYDMQDDGEFIFIQSSSGDWQIQTRQEPWVYNPTRASVNTAFATEMDGNTVIYDMDNPTNQKLQINGVNITLNSGQSYNVGNSIIERNSSNKYTFRYAGPDGILFTGDDDRFVATQGSTHINLNVYPAPYRANQMEGLLGNADGISSNDFVLRDGTQLPSNISFADIHEVFAESWRVTQQESLFGTPIFDDPNFPIYFTQDDIDPQEWADALQAARDAGIPEALVEEVALDFFLSGGDQAFLDEAAEILGQGITLDISPSQVLEDGNNNLVYTFTRDGNTDGILTVNYEIGGTATINDDYTLDGASGLAGNLGSIYFGVGESTKTLIIDPIADNLVEGDETITITLATAPEYTVDTTNAVEGIINELNNTPPALNIPIRGQELRVTPKIPLILGISEFTFADNTFIDPDPGDVLTYKAEKLHDVSGWYRRYVNGVWDPVATGWTSSDIIDNDLNSGPVVGLAFDPSTRTFQTRTDDRQFHWVKVTATDSFGEEDASYFDFSNYVGRVIDNYIVNANVFLDVNGNGEHDVDEPLGISDGNGDFNFNGLSLVDYDLNLNGTIDPDEGSLVALGGIDTATGLPLETPLRATPDATVITLLTTVVAELVDQGLTVEEANTSITNALSIPSDVGINVFDPIAVTNNNELGGVETFSAMVQVQNLITQTTGLIAGASGLANGAIVDQVVNAIATQIQTNTTLNLTNVDQIETIINDSATGLGVDVSALSTGATQIIVAANQKIEEAIADSSPNELEEAFAKVQKIALGESTNDLEEVGAGTKSIEEAVAENTGDALDEQINNTEVLSANPTDISLSNDTVAEEQAIGTEVGTFSTVDPDTGETHTYSLVPGFGDTDNDNFEIVDNVLKTTVSFDYETQTEHSIRVQTSDGNGGVYFEDFTINVSDVNEIVGTSGRDVLTGTDSDDLITGMQGPDTLRGNLGNDKFVYTSLMDAGDRIQDFTPGEDQIVLTDVLESFGYNGSDPIADGYLRFGSRSGHSFLMLDVDGSAGSSPARTFALIQNVALADLNSASNFVFLRPI
ncbi:Serine protease, subtilase family [Crocosphaera watsonii WH 8502]|uniref:Serine protease, subtilase family n=2 Tax=Crocosphaera watsonii TaxID=263511 RepID=T2IL56_CROWT|nr:Serine protease, subtilase family [Crocosphaera watsonii WH 8502]